jgi:orotate phosphoribosyltransferase
MVLTMSAEREIAKKLLQIKAIKLSPQKPFTWASGWRSPIYCDNRTLLSFPEVRSFVIDQFVAASKGFEPFDAVAGVATAGIPHGALLADRLQSPFIYVRSKVKSHGRQNRIEGKLDKGQRVLVIEDLISTGGSSIEAVEALREAGAEVVGVLAIFTYGFDRAVQSFAEADCSFQTLSNYDILLAEAADQKYITTEEQQLLANWRKSPETWS